MALRKVRKVVIPVAGLGSRFLPVTKAIPKELLPVISTPIIQFIVEEAIASGLESVVFVTSNQKTSIENYFDSEDLATFKLKAVNKEKLLDHVTSLAEKIDLVSIRQHTQRGLGHAVLQAANVVGNEPFAVMLGDDIMEAPHTPAIAQCLETYYAVDYGSAVGVFRVPRQDTHLYGVAELEGDLSLGGFVRAKSFIEKPAPHEAPSTWALPGRYVFEPSLFQYLRETKPGKNNEIQLTDAMVAQAQKEPVYVRAIEAERHDTGDTLGFIKANVSYALKDAKLGGPLREWLLDRLKGDTP